MAKYFGTNGARGRFDELTPILASKIAQATGLYFNGGKVILASDFRVSGRSLYPSVVGGLIAAGCIVYDLGCVSAPTAEFMIKKIKADGCIILTASHNPPEWNAIKVVDKNGIAISKERGEEIEKLIDAPSVSWEKCGKVIKYENATTDHINEIKKHIKNIKPKKIVIDCGNGAASVIAPRLLTELGAEVVSLNAHPDGRFPGRFSEPSETNVANLILAVKNLKADAGIAWDGDGDRVIFVDEKGNYVIGDKVFALSILWKLQKSKGDVVTTVATSKAAESIAKKFNCKIRFTAIGAPYLCEEIIKKPFSIAGEEVGGVIWPELSFAKDGFMTSAKLLEAICDKSLSEWLNEIPVYYNIKKKISANSIQKKKIVEALLVYAKKEKLNLNSIDGVRIDFDNSWVIVRASGTEDYVRVFAEATDKTIAENLAEKFEKIAIKAL